MKEIVFVTTNKGKVESAKKYFEGTDITLLNLEHELIEPRSDDVKEIARQKVLQAYEITKKPCFALDSGFFIEALNGFPKTFVNSTLTTIGVKGILKLMENEENRTCHFKECVAYYNGKDMHFFESISYGTLANRQAGNSSNAAWSALWYIFIPKNYTQTMAELTDKQREERKKNSSPSSICKLAEFLKSN